MLKRQLSIVTTRKVITDEETGGKNVAGGRFYDFYFHSGKPPRISEKFLGGRIVSVRRLPMIFSELPDALAEQEKHRGWKIIGEIKYALGGTEARIFYYYPKEGAGGEVKRLGYYLSSISARDIALKDGVTAITSSTLFVFSDIAGKQPPFIASHERVGLKVDQLTGLYVQVEEYLRAMGRGINGKRKLARA